MIDLPLIGNMIGYNTISEFYLHAIPSYAWNDKHCYGGNKANHRRDNDNNINGQHSATRATLPNFHTQEGRLNHFPQHYRRSLPDTEVCCNWPAQALELLVRVEQLVSLCLPLPLPKKFQRKKNHSYSVCMCVCVAYAFRVIVSHKLAG